MHFYVCFNVLLTMGGHPAMVAYILLVTIVTVVTIVFVFTLFYMRLFCKMKFLLLIHVTTGRCLSYVSSHT